MKNHYIWPSCSDYRDTSEVRTQDTSDRQFGAEVSQTFGHLGTDS